MTRRALFSVRGEQHRFTGETGFTRAKRAACAYWLDLIETSFTALAPDDF
jgi:hypothetical protein